MKHKIESVRMSPPKKGGQRVEGLSKKETGLRDKDNSVGIAGQGRYKRMEW